MKKPLCKPVLNHDTTIEQLYRSRLAALQRNELSEESDTRAAVAYPVFGTDASFLCVSGLDRSEII